MRFYKNQHQFYIGIDLHARNMIVLKSKKFFCTINSGRFNKRRRHSWFHILPHKKHKRRRGNC